MIETAAIGVACITGVIGIAATVSAIRFPDFGEAIVAGVSLFITYLLLNFGGVL